MTHVRELFQVPETIGKLDYVLQLTSGIEHPEQTAGLYVVTPGLADAFDRSLALVGRAMRDGRSQAAYLHGSFGSGKSHFMAMLSLMLSGQEAAWRLPELHSLREKHEFVGKKKLLQLHFHMVGRNSIEEAIFTEYVGFAERHHPMATVPGVFADEKLFEDARRMLEELGDEAFFRPMNADAQADAGWGEFATAGGWDRESFEAAVASTQVKERERLFSALVKTRFQAYAQESRAYVAMDDGLSVIARHAKDLGYDALVLFLDELILWLSHGAANAGWLHGEVQKMVKLVETQEAARAIPFVSFIARQRNLVDMVGEQYAGAEVARLNDSLKHWEGRYDTVRLEDSNLPEIISRRVLRPKDDAATATIATAFDQLQKTTGKAAWNTLLAQEDAQAFRKTYPFSPALIEALVALSSFLQRERTAIRVLMEMLYEHINDLPLGEVVRVGDLFDLLAGGADAVDGVMRSRVEAAKQLYKFQFLPVIQAANGTDNEAKCQRLRDGHPTRLGCANCPQKACRTDNRLVTTLLIAALVPEVKSLKALSASRLVQLNHGSIKVPIEGTEAGLVGQKLRKWASEISQLRVGDQPDPTVSVLLEGVDVGPILEAARLADKPMERQRVIRDLLFDALGVDKVIDWGKDHTVSWRSTQRLGHLRFGNVRKMPDDHLKCPDDHDWRVVVDYPFDEPGFSPNDDLARVDSFVEGGGGSWTLVWLPHFFSQSSNKLLGELVILEHIFESKENERRYLAHLSVENQARAHLDLDNLRNQKRNRLRQLLEQAYGLARREEEALDSGALADTQLRVLKPGARVQAALAANLGDALGAYVEALLEARYPRHPAFTKSLTARRVDEMAAAFSSVVESDAKRVPADKDLRDEVAGTLGVLGLVRTTENAIFLREDDLLQQLERKRAQKGLDEVGAGELRGFIDDARNMGLQASAQDLVIRCYARWANRTFVSLGKPFTPNAKQRIPDEVVLEKPELPSQDAWSKALNKAGAAFGIALGGRALHADHLKEFEEKLRTALEKGAGACAKLPGALGRRATELGLPSDTDRMRTAKCADKLCTELLGQRVVDQVQHLAAAELQTGDRAVGRSVGAVVETVVALNDDLAFGAFDQLRARASAIVGGSELLEQVAAALRQDEVNVALAERIRVLALEAMRLLRPPQLDDPPKQRKVLYSGQLTGRAALQEALAKLDTLAKEHGSELEVAGSIEIRTRKP